MAALNEVDQLPKPLVVSHVARVQPRHAARRAWRWFVPPTAPSARVQVDLNGDGHLEVVVATADNKLQLIQPAAHGRFGEGFAQAKVLAEVSLASSKVAVGQQRWPVRHAAAAASVGAAGSARLLAAGWQGEDASKGRMRSFVPWPGAPGHGERAGVCRGGPRCRDMARLAGVQVAMAAGHLDPPPREQIRPPRKQASGAQGRPCARCHMEPASRRNTLTRLATHPRLAAQVLVVVTASWQVLAFDHNLKLMWQQPLHESLPAHASVREVRAWSCAAPPGA